MKLILDDTAYYAYTAAHELREDRQTVVFVHGTAMDHTVWALQSRFFAYHNYNILAIDLPGHNLSQGQLLASIEQMAQWLNNLINLTPASGFHLVGHSMGSLITLEAATTFNHKTAPLHSLTLVGFSYPMSVTPQLLQAAQDTPSKAYSMMTQWSHTSKIGGEPNPGFWSPGMQMSMMENSQKSAVQVDLNACHHYTGGEIALDKVACPVLFLSGQMDKMAPAKLAVVHARKNPAAEIILIPDCGHSLMSEQPDGVLNELKRFIGKTGAR